MKNIIKPILLILILNIVSCNSKPKESVKEVAKNDVEKTIPTQNKLITVGVFDGNGAGAVSVIETIEALKIDKDINAIPISASDIMSGKLNQIDAIIFPGGSGSKQVNNLGRLGQVKVKEFINKGKGAIGICAGAYMFCKTEGYPSLQIADVKHLDRAHYARGRGLIEFKLNEEGEKIFPEFKGIRQFIQYYDGPIMQALGNDKTFTPLATYQSDIHPNAGDPVNFTPGKLFMYHEQIGEGRIFAIGGHAESTPGIRWIIPRMARWVTGKKLVSYDKKWIDPQRNTKEILFDKDLKKIEKKTWWELLSEDADTQIAAMDKLYDIRSRPAVRWNVGLLRDNHAKTRAHAAALLQKAEYTDAYKDVKTAYEMEKDESTKAVMKKAMNFLKL